ncbi:bile acid:sodium symporter family protein [Streptomyces sp. NPDC060194]|uniref:bile acid:sodium symporter family protein n=1 Tax=Streptomyces sp. NPDC060194 TaxID=3347069 RepID=UPI00364B1E37
MNSVLTSVGLPVALGVIMFGLGLSLTTDDFRAVRRHPGAVLIALACQTLLLPLLCFGLVVAVGLPPLLAIGMMLLAASPGGSTANLFSHLFRGDVALNITLTAVNSVVALVTMPLIANLAVGWFDAGDDVSLTYAKVVEVFAVVLVPVVLGMAVRAANAGFAARMDRPVRIASALLLGVMVVGVLASQRESIADHGARVGLTAAVFCVLSVLLGYYLPRALGVRERQAVASSFEIGIHNATLAIYVAENALGSTLAAVPAALYGTLSFFVAAAWGTLLVRVLLSRPAAPAAAREPQPAP